MKAIVHHKYGSPNVLKLEEVEKPVPKANEVLVKIHAVSINGSDREGLIGKPAYVRMSGFLKPRYPILGSDIAGRVESVGGSVTEFKPGDEVFGEIPGYHGGFAEYACLPEKRLLPKPATLTFEQVSTLPQAGVIALQAIRHKGQVQPGQHILINGAGGSAGSFAVQLAKLQGAGVTAVDNTGKMDFLRTLGADHVIDYMREDFTKNKGQYDMILDVIAHHAVFDYARALKPGGSSYFVGGSLGVLFQTLLLGPVVQRMTGKKIRLLVVQPNRKDLQAIMELCEAGKVVPMIDRQYPLAGVPEAMRYVGEGRAKGKVVITVE